MSADLQKCRQHYNQLSPHIKDRDTAELLLAAIQIAEGLEEAANGVIAGFDARVFVRNTDGDADSDWAVMALPHIAALGKLAALSRVTKLEGE